MAAPQTDGRDYTARPVAGQPGTWTVRADSAGTFAAFADPRTGLAWQGRGAVAGWVDYTVTSTHAPDARNLPARVAGSLSTSDLLRLLFGDPSAQVTGGHYWFGYWPVNGQLYTQQG